jgi:hypothetical protein
VLPRAAKEKAPLPLDGVLLICNIASYLPVTPLTALVNAAITGRWEKGLPMTACCNTLTLDALLADPVTQAVMKADRVDPAALRVMLRSVALDTRRVTVQIGNTKSESKRTRFNHGAVTPSTQSADRRRGNASVHAAVSAIRQSMFCGAC